MKLALVVLGVAVWIFAAGFACGTMNAPQVTPMQCEVTTQDSGLAYAEMLRVRGREMVRAVGGGWCVRQSRID